MNSHKAIENKLSFRGYKLSGEFTGELYDEYDFQLYSML